MAPTRRRNSLGDDEPDSGRSPKAHRLSDGSRASTGGSSGSTTGSAAGGSPLPDTDAMDQDQDLPAQEEKEQEDEQHPAGSDRANKGNKGKRRAVLNGDDEDEPFEEEEEKENEADDIAAKARKITELCRDQDVEERRRLAGEGGGESDGEGGEGSAVPDGKENEGLPPLNVNNKKGKTGGLSANRKSKRENDNSRSKSEAGVVLKINVSNFMCHRKLTVPLCRQVNFINGRNGSGKSAILAALQICLGAKAHLTHRAKKMSDFIRHGWKGDAVLEVTLLNDEHGFKFDDYGESVTVRRTIKQPTGGGFALIGHDGEVKSREKAELFRMLDTLNIQVDNPCAVLDQENSKKFLQGSESEKYAFFMKATDLDRISADNEATGVAISKMMDGHHELLDVLPRYKDVAVRLKEEVRQYEALEELSSKISRLKEQIAWAIVNESEINVASLTEEIKGKSVYISKCEEKIAVLEEEIAQIVAEKERVKERYDEGVAETQRLKKVVQEKGRELQVAQAPLLLMRAQNAALMNEKRQKSAAKGAASKKVQAAREVAKRTASDQREKALHEKIQQTDSSLAGVGRMREGRGGDEKMFGLRRAVDEAKAKAVRAKDDWDNSNKDLTASKAELRSLETGAFDPLSALGGYMPALVKRIQQAAGQFRKLPVGPIGMSIQLKEEWKRFKVCIEGHLSNNLTNFVVSCQQDKSTLMTLMKDFRRNKAQMGRLPTIIVQAPQARYRPNENPAGFLQIMQAINVTDHQAFNALVDQCSIEKTCLFSSKEEAERACLKGPSGRYERMPHGMFEAYYPSQGGSSCNKFTVVEGNVQTRMNVVNAKRHKSVLGVDEGTRKEEVKLQVEQATAAVEQTRAVADCLARDAKAKDAALKEEEQARARLDSHESQLSREKNRLATELMALQANKNDTSDPTEELERAFEVASEELEGVMKELATLEGTIREVMAQVQPFKDAKLAAHQAHKECYDATQRIQEEFEDGGQDEHARQTKVNRLRSILQKATEELAVLNSRKEDEEAVLKGKIEKASIYMTNIRANVGERWDGKRVEVKHSIDHLRHKMATQTARYEKEREKKQLRSKCKEQVVDELDKAIAVYKEKRAMAQQLEENMAMLSSERKQRSKKWRMMRDYVARKTSDIFNDYLQDKGASGEVCFDNENQTLSLTYQKNSNDDASQCNDVKLLSGGEKSFATLALLLALGHNHECPFRVMDEFDVFMDAMSRNIAIKQVIEFAKRNSSRQFILITPQDLSSVTPSDTCKIIKMKPPRKGDHNQATLEESFGGGAV